MILAFPEDPEYKEAKEDRSKNHEGQALLNDRDPSIYPSPASKPRQLLLARFVVSSQIARSPISPPMPSEHRVSAEVMTARFHIMRISRCRSWLDMGRVAADRKRPNVDGQGGCGEEGRQGGVALFARLMWRVALWNLRLSIEGRLMTKIRKVRKEYTHA